MANRTDQKTADASRLDAARIREIGCVLWAPGDWINYRRTYNGHVFSPLDQINTSNVKSLTPVWTLSTGVIEGHEAPPLVNNGVMFIATPQNQVIAADAIASSWMSDG